ncbi:myosin-G heavy chain-like [Octopus vulgaris]|uniref:Myosin-G heavy chain-like n=2 Tax=Octopus TaxID=6643 RepID=A0AA36FCK8_OCTVU|nr:myosin-G heavy chain-like [Octopus sinensis]XP_029644960.1 myosin-G heavy chain-like [Octopus sinensis]XP_036364599.1 myosin-G heavy chain-like [Octopus sinensis]XP_036364600.1 myosin-G heavy chain-like [Octopus sinensis]XP_036364601.1 myosin-G heavy chain-like [Octopus sinensis]CAI9732607.1 myosin-G heavy chain-like [Octopus vulgaris]
MQPSPAAPKKRKRVHSCSICGGSYSTPSQLQRHSRVHSGERPYVCNLCGRRFTRSDHVKQHLKIHSPHRQKNMCRICGSQFYKSQILGSHLRRHDVYQIHLCHQCGEGFQEAEELEKHERLHNIKTDIRSSGEGADGVPSTSTETSTTEGEGKWLGCARFCLAQIPSIGNKIVQPSDRKTDTSNNAVGGDQDSNNSNNASADINDNNNTTTVIMAANLQDQSFDADLSTSKPSSNEDNEPLQIAVSPGYSLVGPAADVGDESTITASDALPSSSNAAFYMVTGKSGSNSTDTEGALSKSTTVDGNSNRSALRKASRPQKAVIKREPVVSSGTKTAPRCTISLLATNKSSVTRAEVCTRRMISSNKTTGISNSVVLTAVNSHSNNNSNNNNNTNNSNNNSNSNNNNNSNNNSNNPSSLTLPPYLLNGKRLGRCEYCGIWFEDYAMCMLHNSLHSADDADPFTCRKCLKKLGNRLEFMAHLVWHLDPELP